MYPGPSAPDLGVFVERLELELARLGHSVVRSVIDRRGGSLAKYADLGLDAVEKARRLRPHVVYGHFLFPAGGAAALAALASGARLVVTAHGQDVRNIGTIPGVREATRLALRRAGAVIAVSDYLRRELEAKLPELRGRIHVVDCGVDLERFRDRDRALMRERLGWGGGGTHYLFVGSLTPRKNPLRLADAFTRLDAGTLAFVGDGPLRGPLAGRSGIVLAGRVAHSHVPDWIGACDVLCQPSLIEPFGQAILEALAAERPVVATRIGGPPEFVPPGAGLLVDPGSVASIEAGLRAAAELPVPNAAGRAAAREHDVRLQAGRIAAILEGGQ
jgi:glycosyltransferase involved in cell wall biosynthesis